MVLLLLLHGILQSLAGLEGGDLAGGDLHSLLGLGIDAGALSTLLHLKRAEAHDLHLTVGLHALSDGSKGSGNSDLSILLSSKSIFLCCAANSVKPRIKAKMHRWRCLLDEFTTLTCSMQAFF